MSRLENSNKPMRSRIVLLLRSNLAALGSLFRKSKFRLGLAGVATLAAVPVAAFAAQSFSDSPDTSANHTSQPAGETPSAQAETPVVEQVPPPAASTSASNGAQNQTSTTTQVTVNGESIPVPENGSVHRTIDTGNGQVTVNVDNSTTTANPGNSYTSVHSFSSSASSSVNVNQSTNIGGNSQ